MQWEDTNMGMQWRERIIDAFSQKVYDLVIPHNHFLRRVNQEVDFSFINPLCASKYKQGKAGRRAEAPEGLFRALLIMIVYAIPFETSLAREIALNLAYRWFCGLGIGEPVFDHSLFYVLRKRLGVALFEEVLARIVEQCIAQNLVGNTWVFYDTTDIAASATRYTPYERAVIIARAVIRLLEEHPADNGADPSQPPTEASPALRRLAAQMAQEVAGAKDRAREPIVRKVEQLTQQVATTDIETAAEPLPHLERAAVALAEQAPVAVGTDPQALKAALTQLHQEMPRARGDADARIGHTSTGETFCGYLSGNMVDGKYSVITATHLEAGNQYAPTGLVESGVAEQHVERVGAPPQQGALDAAFDHPDVHDHLAKTWPGTTTFIHPMPMPKPVRDVFGMEAFTLTQANELICPNPALKMEEAIMRVRRTDPDGTLVYEGQGCEGCPIRTQCTTRVNGPRTVTLNPETHRRRLAAVLLAQTAEHREAMKRRFAYAEAPYGHGKRHHRWGKAPYRSRWMNRIFNLLVVIVHNIEKIVRYAPLERRKRLAMA
jgi:transposase